MQYDIDRKLDVVLFTKQAFITIFKNDVILLEENVALEHMGYFQYKFHYSPLNYILEFENDRNIFSITIYDKDNCNCFSNLYETVKYDYELDQDNIYNAITLLYEAIKTNNLQFYKSENDKLYKKINGEYKRVRDRR